MTQNDRIQIIFSGSAKNFKFKAQITSSSIEGISVPDNNLPVTVEVRDPLIKFLAKEREPGFGGIRAIFARQKEKDLPVIYVTAWDLLGFPDTENPEEIPPPLIQTVSLNGKRFRPEFVGFGSRVASLQASIVVHHPMKKIVNSLAKVLDAPTERLLDKIEVSWQTDELLEEEIVSIPVVDTTIQDKDGYPVYTGAHFLQVDKDITASTLKRDAAKASLSILSVTDLGKKQNSASMDEVLTKYDGIIFPKTGAVLFNGGIEAKLDRLVNDSEYFSYSEPERYITTAETKNSDIGPANIPEGAAKWPHVQIGVSPNSSYKGEGISIAIIDTGVQGSHPALAGRPIKGESFIVGEDLDDVVGHGTAVTGIVVEIAPSSDIFWYKVLDKNSNARERTMVLAVETAIEEKINVINMSIVRRYDQGASRFSKAIERLAAEARQEQCLIIAAVGNHADRPAHKAPVCSPASCASVIAVAALTEAGEVYYESNSQVEPTDPVVDISAPGDNILTYSIVNAGYAARSGTSFAAAHVSGIAALFWQRNRGATAEAIWQEMKGKARVLPHPPEDVGAGLVYFK